MTVAGLTPLLNKRALLKIGWTQTLIDSLLGKPDKIEQHKHGYKHWEEHLYTRERVIFGMEAPEFKALEAKRKARKNAAIARQEDFSSKYAGWREALPEACAGMFSLNRYAKHRSCSPLHKHEIYRLKNALIELLYSHGYSTAAWIDRQQLPAQICRECGGTEDADFCHRCGGSGVWREAKTLEFWCFRFLLPNGKQYVWHQPKSTVQFEPTETLPPQDYDGPTGEKPLALSPRKFGLAKELLSWLLSQAACEEETSPPCLTIPATCQDSIPF